MSIPNQLMTIIALWLYFAISCGIWKVSWLFLAIHHIFHLTSHLNSDNCLERLWAIIILYLYMYDRVWDLPGVFYILNVDLQWDSTSSVSCNCLSSVKDKRCKLWMLTLYLAVILEGGSCLSWVFFRDFEWICVRYWISYLFVFLADCMCQGSDSYLAVDLACSCWNLQCLFLYW